MQLISVDNGRNSRQRDCPTLACPHVIADLASSGRGQGDKARLLSRSLVRINGQTEVLRRFWLNRRQVGAHAESMDGAAHSERRIETERAVS